MYEKGVKWIIDLKVLHESVPKSEGMLNSSGATAGANRPRPHAKQGPAEQLLIICEKYSDNCDDSGPLWSGEGAEPKDEAFDYQSIYVTTLPYGQELLGLTERAR